ncbi:hypothetical protein ABZ330_00110 [Streptomyces sp. NPDC006172]|uniref:hypothetical protein n=1 Tax=Streptomyces sp. NPDC006172 TaxID=3154470 RepID=UPI0033D2937C
MASNPEQIGSPECGCCDCLTDYPSQRYGQRPQRDGWGPWRARYRADGRHCRKNSHTRGEAVLFLATVQPEVRSHAS